MDLDSKNRIRISEEEENLSFENKGKKEMSVGIDEHSPIAANECLIKSLSPLLQKRRASSMIYCILI
jgi:hypothetical protein